ncbi:hypothetical protein DFH11DRAFT_1843425 [Phellopilus nigrolimitatus]|nr:hypothetical protein DFH11DRAFT_1843425 [Phellopilus nigrolimitatus]
MSCALNSTPRISYKDVVKVPTMAESISEGTLKQWQKKVGDAVEADEEIATIETDKIDVSVNAPKAGKITALLAKEEETVSVGQDLFKYEPGSGCGPEGPWGARRDAREDVAHAATHRGAAQESQNAAASLTTFNEIDMSALMALRSKYKEGILKQHEVKLGFMSAFARAAIEGDEVVYRDYVDLSVAVATPKGLVTPVVRNAETMGFVDIEKEIAELGKKARDGKLSLEDMAGGSNGGVFGSLYGTPIINLPQAAVLGMHTIKERPVVVNGEIVIRPIMVVALTYDHRLLDGRDAVTFLVKVRDYIEDPLKMLF